MSKPDSGGRCYICPKRFFAGLKKMRADDISRYSPDTSGDRFLETYKPAKRFDVPMRLAVGHSYHTSEAALRYHDRADWQHVQPQIKVFAARFIDYMRRRDIPLYVHGAYRTAQEQQAAVAAGNSKTQWPRAAHCQGAAVDIVHMRYQWALQKDEWAYLGKIGQDMAERMGLALTWGGNWSSPWDPAHWEIKGWQEHIVRPETGPPIRKTPRAILSEYKGY